MADFFDMFERALKGPVMSESDFEMRRFMPKVHELVRKYEIKFDRETPVPSDETLVENLFKAAVELVKEVGFYCTDTNRVMEFSEEEIHDRIRTAKGVCYAGEGKDAGIFGTRKPDEKSLPWMHVGSGIVISSKDLMYNLIESYAQIEEANSISISSLESIKGFSVTAGSPVELYAAIEGVKVGRDALRRAGRPGLPIMNLISTAASAVTTIGASAAQFGLRPTDGWLCGAISEMKIDFGALNKVAYLLNWGANIGAETSPILGGYAGGAEGTAIVSTAYILMGILVFMGNYQLTFPVHFRYGCSSPRDILWAVATSCQAASKYIPMPVIWLGYMSGGPGTEHYFYEAAAHILTSVTSGAPSVQTPHPAKAVKVDGITPMEARFAVDMIKASSKLTREQAGELVNRLLEKYEPRIPEAPEGKTYQELYDISTGKPKDEYLKLMDNVKEELVRIGIPIE